MKNIKLVYTFLLIIFSVIFYLYNKEYILCADIKILEEIVVFYNYKGSLLGCEFNVEEANINTIFDYLTINKNSAPCDFLSSIDENIKLKSYECRDDYLKLNITDDVILTNKEIPLIYESYRLLGYNTLEIVQHDEAKVFTITDIFNTQAYSNYYDDTLDGELYYCYSINESISFSLCYEDISKERKLCELLNLTNIKTINNDLYITTTNYNDNLLNTIILNYKDYRIYINGELVYEI